MIVFPQNTNQVLRHENGVVVAHHEPPHVLQPQPQRLRHDPRDPDRRPVPLPVRVPEPGGVAGDSHRRERVVVGLRRHVLVEPDDAAHLPRSVLELDVVLALVPELGGGGDAKDDVAEGGAVLGVGLAGLAAEEGGGGGGGIDGEGVSGEGKVVAGA